MFSVSPQYASSSAPPTKQVAHFAQDDDDPWLRALRQIDTAHVPYTPIEHTQRRHAPPQSIHSTHSTPPTHSGSYFSTTPSSSRIPRAFGDRDGVNSFPERTAVRSSGGERNYTLRKAESDTSIGSARTRSLASLSSARSRMPLPEFPKKPRETWEQSTAWGRTPFTIDREREQTTSSWWSPPAEQASAFDTHTQRRTATPSPSSGKSNARRGDRKRQREGDLSDDEWVRAQTQTQGRKRERRYQYSADVQQAMERSRERALRRKRESNTNSGRDMDTWSMSSLQSGRTNGSTSAVTLLWLQQSRRRTEKRREGFALAKRRRRQRDEAWTELDAKKQKEAYLQLEECALHEQRKRQERERREHQIVQRQQRWEAIKRLTPLVLQELIEEVCHEVSVAEATEALARSVKSTTAHKLTPLEADQETFVADLLSRSDNATVLVDKFNIEVKVADITTLNPGTWLNDEVINFYMELLKQRQETRQQDPSLVSEKKCRCHFFNTFFSAKFKNGYDYKGVRRWSKRAKVKIIELDKVLVPVHVGTNHWCCSVINFTQKRFEYYDSLGGQNPQLLGYLRQYVVDEAKQYSNTPNYDLSQWSDYTPSDVPMQNNGSDCGVFTAKFADYLSENSPLDFDHTHMPYFRKRMVLEIMNQRID